MYPPDHFEKMTEHQLRDGMTAAVASLTYRISCEDELKQRNLPTRHADGCPIGPDNG